MKSDIVSYKNSKVTYELKVAEADAETGMFRTMLQDQAIADENTGEVDTKDLRAVSRRLLHTIIYPSIMAASTPVKGFKEWPIPFDEFKKLPEPLVIQLEEKVFTLNPHWRPLPLTNPADVEEQEKKVADSSPKS